VCLNGSFLALFQLEGFALVRRRHGCGGRKGCYVRRVTSNPRAMYTRGGRNKGHHPFPPSLREDLRDALEILVPRLLRIPRESRCLAGNESTKIGSRSGRHVAWAHALDRDIWLPITTVSLSRVQ